MILGSRDAMNIITVESLIHVLTNRCVAGFSRDIHDCTLGTEIIAQ